MGTVRKKRKKGIVGFAFRIFERIREDIRHALGIYSVPKQYRPYLGPDAPTELVEEKKYENTRVSIRKYYKKQLKRDRRNWRSRWPFSKVMPRKRKLRK